MKQRAIGRVSGSSGRIERWRMRMGGRGRAPTAGGAETRCAPPRPCALVSRRPLPCLSVLPLPTTKRARLWAAASSSQITSDRGAAKASPQVRGTRATRPAPWPAAPCLLSGLKQPGPAVRHTAGAVLRPGSHARRPSSSRRQQRNPRSPGWPSQRERGDGPRARVAPPAAGAALRGRGASGAFCPPTRPRCGSAG